MNETLLLIQSAIIGFSIALPVGPVAILCIRRTIASGIIAGYATGLGATLADTVFGAIAIFGISYIAEFLHEHENAVRAVGAAILIGMGVYYVRHRPPNVGDPVAADVQHRFATVLRFFLSSLAITMFNPLTIGAFAAVFAASGVGREVTTNTQAAIAIAGVAIGAAGWWFLLCSASQAMRRFFSHSSLQWLNWISGGILIVLGLFIVASFLVPGGVNLF